MAFDMVRSVAELRKCLGEKSLVSVIRQPREMSTGRFVKVGRRIGKVVSCNGYSLTVQWADADGRLTQEKKHLHHSTYKVLYRSA